MPARKSRPSLINRGLDDLKVRMDLPSDAALAEHLKVSRQMLSAVRAGKRVPLEMLGKVLDKGGYAVTRDGLLSLMPQKMATAIKSYDNRRAAQRSRVLEDERLSRLLIEVDGALEHYAADELVDAIEHYVTARR